MNLHHNTPDNVTGRDERMSRLVTQKAPRRQRLLFALGGGLLLLVAIAAGGFFWARHWMRATLRDNLPQVDGEIQVNGLAAPVTVARDSHGVPHIGASSMEDLVFAQGYVTASDRLWQMDALRRHAAGTLAEVLGSGLIDHDKLQRTLQIRAAADRALAVLPADQRHWLEMYAKGVNASMAEQSVHLPLEFKILRYAPEPWEPRDSLLVGLAMFEDLTTSFPEALHREAFSAKLSPELVADLYPVGSWRDHPVSQPAVDLTAPQPEIQEVPLDETQTELRLKEHVRDLSHVRSVLAMASARYLCGGCASGSNGWAVAGAKTASGKTMLSSDMHLAHNVPGIWYMASLESGDFHVSGVTLPGAPFVIVGHNQHIAWGFTNLGAAVQDVNVEQTRSSGANEEFQAADGSWHPVVRHAEVIRVKGGKDVTLDLTATIHEGLETPIISSLYPHEKRALALRWTIYDPANVTSPFFAINSARDWKSLCAAASLFGGPAQNLQYADDQGHIGYHAIGKVPVRGSMTAPTQISPVPTDGRDPLGKWVGYIPFDSMPQAFDPPGGVIATANARVTPDGYAFPITLDWAEPYRNQRIWKVLQAKSNLKPADMLALQTDVYSDADKVIAQRLTYAIDHSNVEAKYSAASAKRLRQAADILRIWSGDVDEDSAAAAITVAARRAFWEMVLGAKLGVTDAVASSNNDDNPLLLYDWGESIYAEEQLIVNQPQRWLPAQYADWNSLLAGTVDKALAEGHAPADLSKWTYGKDHPVEIEHPVFSKIPALKWVLALPTGTGTLPQSGDRTTVKQVGRKFGPSERMTVDFGDLDSSTLNVVLGESANPESPWFRDQWSAWYRGAALPMPFSQTATAAAAAHMLTLVPR